jgi:myo-inositol-1-phosphate synthase
VVRLDRGVHQGRPQHATAGVRGALDAERRGHRPVDALRLRGDHGGLRLRQRRPEPHADIPALLELADQKGVALSGKDFKTGQTWMKTVIAPGIKARMLGLAGWYSTNILGNRDGEVLDDPARSRPRRSRSCRCCHDILQPDKYPELYKGFSHVVRINYYPPRGDNKEGWDNIDIVGWMGYPMQIKVNFLCRDSILRRRSCSTWRCSATSRQRAGHEGDPGVALVLLQEPDDGGRAAAGARPVHPADEAEEHAPAPDGRGSDHAPRLEYYA